jgi:hypothetical protein
VIRLPAANSFEQYRSGTDVTFDAIVTGLKKAASNLK